MDLEGVTLSLESVPFTRYHEEKKIDSFTCRLNEEERKLLDSCKSILEQKKDSTALKMLAWYGAKVLHEEKTSFLLSLVFKNKSKNSRLGIIDFD